MGTKKRKFLKRSEKNLCLQRGGKLKINSRKQQRLRRHWDGIFRVLKRER
jgi:hypothetical protein